MCWLTQVDLYNGCKMVVVVVVVIIISLGVKGGRLLSPVCCARYRHLYLDRCLSFYKHSPLESNVLQISKVHLGDGLKLAAASWIQ